MTKDTKGGMRKNQRPPMFTPPIAQVVGGAGSTGGGISPLASAAVAVDRARMTTVTTAHSFFRNLFI